jgi:hypothetical protein
MDGRRLKNNDRGNINLDFLIGLVVFMTAFVYMINAVPAIFIPYQTNSVDLGSVVYRTSCILAEDPGWWANTSISNASYTDWETSNNTGNLTRVGLAVDKRSPNVLLLNKIHGMSNLPYIKSRDKMGLNGTVSYNYSLLIKDISSNQTILDITNPYMTDNVDTLDRLVLIREGEGLFMDSDNPGPLGYSDMMVLGKDPRFDDDNVTVRIVNFESNPFCTENLTVVYYVGPFYGDPDFAINASYVDHDFYIYKNNTYVPDYINAPYNLSDTIDVIVDAEKIRNKCYSSFGYNVSRMAISSNLTGLLHADYQDYNQTNPNYRYFQKTGQMTLRVWQT